MILLRYVLLALVLVFFVISLVATLPLPLYSQKIRDYNQDGEVIVSMWFISVGEVTLTGENATVTPTSLPVRVNYAGCEDFRATFRSLQAFSIGGTVFGFYAVLLSSLQSFFRLKVKLPLFLFILLATLCELLSVLVAGIAHSKEFCTNVDGSTNVTPVVFKNAGYRLSSSFTLHVVALVGYFSCLLITPFTQQLWCGKR
ncbi:hypothetical protein JKF63_00690 [Porcisia hertigi]|uniref:Uncharacterized protein n=1 Tax=Porcisia hertigi TaxID=2761500 RepID=A0A836I8Q1_9TRYP|nr:hypothetical protein JKF63_00690 [Porcisia hertigi]